MRVKYTLLVIVACFGATSVGCAHRQLRHSTVKQADTVADLHQQQVLDNLAKFVYDYNSLPHFAFADAGAASVDDSGSVSLGLGWIADGFDSASLGIGGSRGLSQSWTLVPINDPRKLELMRCAYQRALASCGRAVESMNCPDCQSRFNAFYTGVPSTASTRESGTVNDACIGTSCWFGFGCKECIPQTCECNYVGHYCGVYVWVLPEGRDELAKLTLAILDYAIYEPAKAPGAPKRTVEEVYGPDQKLLSRKVTYEEDRPAVVSDPTIETLPVPPANDVQRERTPTPSWLEFELRRRTLTPGR